VDRRLIYTGTHGSAGEIGDGADYDAQPKTYQYNATSENPESGEGVTKQRDGGPGKILVQFSECR
jgi:hypothetical protein